jgi:hypothetical protein
MSKLDEKHELYFESHFKKVTDLTTNTLASIAYKAKS